MVCFFRTPFLFLRRKGSASVLALALFSGFIFGCFIVSFASGYEPSALYMAFRVKASFASRLIVMLFPVILTLMAIYTRQVWLLIPFAFCKSFSFGYLSSSIIKCCGSSGWLVQLLFLFSDCIALPVLCWLWLSSVRGNRNNVFTRCFAAGILITSVVYLDNQFISPFLVCLLS